MKGSIIESVRGVASHFAGSVVMEVFPSAKMWKGVLSCVGILTVSDDRDRELPKIPF